MQGLPVLMDKRRNVFGGGGGVQTSVAPIIENSLLGRELFGKNDGKNGRNNDRRAALFKNTLERGDSRYPEMVRPFEVQFISTSKIFFQSEGGTVKLSCSVMGPRSAGPRQATGNAIASQTKIGRSYQTLSNLSCEINWAPFSSSLCRLGHQPMEEENDVALALLQSLAPVIRREKYPNSFIDIYITVLEMDGPILASCITAASMTLISSGIEMLDSVVGISMALVDEDPSKSSSAKVMLMDLSGEEDFLVGKQRTPPPFRLCMAILPNLGLCSQIYGGGSFNLTTNICGGSNDDDDDHADDDSLYLTECITAAKEASQTLYDSIIRPALMEMLSNNN